MEKKIQVASSITVWERGVMEAPLGVRTHRPGRKHSWLGRRKNIRTANTILFSGSECPVRGGTQGLIGQMWGQVAPNGDSTYLVGGWTRSQQGSVKESSLKHLIAHY